MLDTGYRIQDAGYLMTENICKKKTGLIKVFTQTK